MTGWWRALSMIGTTLAALVGGVVGAIAVSLLATDIGFRLTLPANYDAAYPGPGDGFVLAPFFIVGAVVGFWGGVCLVLYGRHKLAHRKLSPSMTNHPAT